MSEEMYENCNYKFKGKSCKDCPLKCKGKECELQHLKQENEELKYEIDRQKETIIYLENYDMCHKTLIQYEQALEEIRKETHRLLYQQNPIYGYDNSNYFELLSKFILKKTNEVLNDRD